ncbi:Hydrogenase 2 maturation protease [Candidatus Zixiibacteriota bacterium]|nr:Hydrogenase 2 maturation protease [candidate division Zixibacteria bacterium]
MKTLVLGLGNDILADDAVGILTARALKDEEKGQVEINESALHGLALLELFIGYDRAIIIDAIQTGQYEPGTVIELEPADLGAVTAPSPHYSGLPEMLHIAGELNLHFPKEIKILALEVEDPYSVRESLTVSAQEGMLKLKEMVKKQLRIWNEPD